MKIFTINQLFSSFTKNLPLTNFFTIRQKKTPLFILTINQLVKLTKYTVKILNTQTNNFIKIKYNIKKNIKIHKGTTSKFDKIPQVSVS